MDLQLTGKLALITGSTAGIGYAIAESLAGEGARVIVNGRTQARVDAAVARIEASGKEVLSLVADLGSSKGAAEAIARFPDVDILINNLGIFEAKAFEAIGDDDWFHLFEVNVLSGVRLSRHYLPRMKAAGWGRIIFLSSESGIQIPAEMIHYGLTKTAQLALSRGLAETTTGTGVTVNAILPGPTASEGVGRFVEGLAEQQGTDRKTVEKEFFRTMRPTSLLGRFATPAEVAALVTFVCSPLSAATNGAALRVDGGVVRSVI
jgi:NAD(P)-dependent dehydrogenase (short-subunit alcohol dehydrogenase family)